METKYRDIADVNLLIVDSATIFVIGVGNQVPRYSGCKPSSSCPLEMPQVNVGNQVPRYSGCKLPIVIACIRRSWLETKYRDIADVNTDLSRHFTVFPLLLETKYRDIADVNSRRTPNGLCPGRTVGNQVPRYSGCKRIDVPATSDGSAAVGNQVPRYSGCKLLVRSSILCTL